MQQVTSETAADVRSLGVGAYLAAHGWRETALIDVTTGASVRLQFVTRRAGADERADRVGADALAAAIVVLTLVDVRAADAVRDVCMEHAPSKMLKL